VLDSFLIRRWYLSLGLLAWLVSIGSQFDHFEFVSSHHPSHSNPGFALANKPSLVVAHAKFDQHKISRGRKEDLKGYASPIVNLPQGGRTTLVTLAAKSIYFSYYSVTSFSRPPPVLII
jgi:hypothetical protein